MADELQTSSPTGSTVYAILRNSVGQVASTQTNTWVSWLDASYNYYKISLSEQGTSGFFIGSLPSWIVNAGVISVSFYNTPSLGASPFAGGDLSSPTGSNTPQAADWIALSDYKTWAGINVSTYDAQLSLMISQASQILDSHLRTSGGSMTQFTWTETYNGTGMSYLQLNNWPVLFINQVIAGFEGDPGSGSEQNYNAIIIPGNQFLVNDQGVIRFAPNAGSFQGSIIGAGNYFIPGFQNYQITYTAGYNPMPFDLQLCCMMVVKFLFSYSNKDPNVTNRKVGPVTVAYGQLLSGDLSDPIFSGIESTLVKYGELGAL